MVPVLRPAVVVLLALGLVGCTAVGPSGPAQSAADSAVRAGEGGSDLGNERPPVTFDGLMVRRRVVVAIHPSVGADLASLRGQLDQAAGRLGLALSDIPPTVLDADVLEHLAPGLIVALPEGGTVDDAGRMIDLATPSGGVLPGVEHFHLGPVLVHDLRFALSTADPVSLRDAIDREGILADALGDYDAAASGGRLRIDYTGPLLSDDLIRSIQAGIARPVRADPAEVSVSPRSTTGVGVDMRVEPAPVPVGVVAPTPHGHSGG